MNKKILKSIPYGFMVILGVSSYFFDMPLMLLFLMMGIALYGVYKIFTIINLPNHKIIIEEDGIEYRGIKYHEAEYCFQYQEFVQKFLGILPIQEDYMFYIYDHEHNLISKIDCILYDLEERNDLIILTKQTA